MSAHEIPAEAARAASAAAAEGEVELLLIGEDGQPRAYRLGPVAATTLSVLLEEALSELGGQAG